MVYPGTVTLCLRADDLQRAKLFYARLGFSVVEEVANQRVVLQRLARLHDPHHRRLHQRLPVVVHLLPRLLRLPEHSHSHTTSQSRLEAWRAAELRRRW